MEQDEHQSDPGSLVCEVVEVAFSVPLQQAVGFHFAKVVAELSEGIFVGGQAEAGEDGLMDISRAPSLELRAAMQQHLHQPYHSRVVNLDAGDSGLAGRHWESDLLKQRKVDVHFERLGFEVDEAIGDAGKLAAQSFQVLQSFVEAEIFHSVDADLYAQERAELFVHAAHEILTVDPHHVMTPVELFQNAIQLASQAFGEAYPKDVSHLVGSQAEQPQLAGALEDLMD